MIVIRKAKLKDIDLILNFEKKLIKSADDIINKYCPQNFVDYRLKNDYEEILSRYIKGRIYSKNDAIFIAELNGKLVGHMIISIKKSHPIFEMDKYGRINTVYIEEKFRGKSISSKLKDEAFKWFKKKDINRVSLNVFPDNEKGINTYKKWGFSTSLIEMRMMIE
jgi:ribosomal protein S18 acetylase RimI-like enzyme